MSELVVRPVVIEEIKPHPNADKLEIAVVGGWDIITGKGNYQVGDVVVHIQPDSMVPKKWADEWDVTQYLSWKKKAESGRVRAAKLRQVVSFGFLVPNESGAELETDLAEHYGITKWEPPAPRGNSAEQGITRYVHPLLHGYTNIENLRNYKNKLDYDIHLVVTEKIHGMNSRVGWVRRTDHTYSDDGRNSASGIHFRNWRDENYEFVIGSHKCQRDLENPGVFDTPYQLHYDSLGYIFEMLAFKYDTIKSVIFFGEIYGAGIQDLHYGQSQEKGYRLFDISVNGEYLDWTTLVELTSRFNVPLVPVLGQGRFTFQELVELAQGDTTLDDSHIREGIVVRPERERCWSRTDKPHRNPNQPEVTKFGRRMIFKLISDAYMTRKGGTEYH